MTQVPVIDLFAGPGGLGEGFSQLRLDDGRRAFRIEASVEMEKSAHRTLRFRAFQRAVKDELGHPLELPDEVDSKRFDEDAWAADLVRNDDAYRALWDKATGEAICAELGGSSHPKSQLKKLSNLKGQCILIGGPPCQAYSLVGRARNRGIAGYVPENDERHYLYQEYIRLIDAFDPLMFVMENVKGMLSAQVGGKRVFDLVQTDLERSGQGYELLPFAPKHGKDLSGEHPRTDFLIRSEEHGVPQARHRVIVAGVRKDLAARIRGRGLAVEPLITIMGDKNSDKANVAGVLANIESRYSGLSRRQDRESGWDSVIDQQIRAVRSSLESSELQVNDRERVLKVLKQVEGEVRDRSTNWNPRETLGSYPNELMTWYGQSPLGRPLNHESRSHMASDLGRYLFAACYATAFGSSPKASDFPRPLWPDHANWQSGKFADRFRVQIASEPSTTVTSHISKDGHYFIHPDPSQCRSLTVREAARLQTFPDDYVFLGNRTQQYVQVGNAVPPYLAHKIAQSVYRVWAHQQSG